MYKHKYYFSSMYKQKHFHNAHTDLKHIYSSTSLTGAWLTQIIHLLESRWFQSHISHVISIIQPGLTRIHSDLEVNTYSEVPSISSLRSSTVFLHNISYIFYRILCLWVWCGMGAFSWIAWNSKSASNEQWNPYGLYIREERFCGNHIQ